MDDMQARGQTGAPDAAFGDVAQIGNELLWQLNAMREVEPIIWSKSAKAWIVNRHADVSKAYSGRLPLSNVRYERCFEAIPEGERAKRLPFTTRSISNWPVFTDPPLHTRLRKLLTRAFSKKVVESLRPFVRGTVNLVLDQAAAKGEVEFVNEIARAITGRVILNILGIPESYLERLELWSLNMNTALGAAHSSANALDIMERDIAEMRGLFLAEIERRRLAPTDDFISEMVKSSDGTDSLTDEEIIGVCYVVLIAGHDTTMNSMALGTAALSKSTVAREHLISHPADITNSVMEVARFSAMSTMQPRIVTQDFEWHGKQLRTGDVVFLMLAGANRDPRAFPNPESLDLSRNTERSLVFGSGIHHCIGHLLAKLQLGELFFPLFDRFDVELLEESLRFAPSLAQRGLERLQVRLRPRSPNSSRDDQRVAVGSA